MKDNRDTLEKLLEDFNPTDHQRDLMGQYYADALRIANSIRMPFVYPEEKETAGIMGLMLAIKYHDSSKKAKFSTYLLQCISNCIRNISIRYQGTQYDVTELKDQDTYVSKVDGKEHFHKKRTLRIKRIYGKNDKGNRVLKEKQIVCDPIRIPSHKILSTISIPNHNDGESNDIFNVVKAPEKFNTLEFTECFNYIKDKLTGRQQEIFEMLIYPELVLSNPKKYNLTPKDVKNKDSVDKTMVGKRYGVSRERGRQLILVLQQKVTKFFDMYGDPDKERRHL